MALKDEIFQKHLSNTKKSFNKKYNHFRPFDDPDHQKKFTVTDYPNNQENDDFKTNDGQKHKSNTNWTQTQHKLDTNPTQTGHSSVTNRTQSEHKLDTKPNTKVNTNSTQTQHKKTNINTIVGVQRKLLFYIYNLCKVNGTKITPPVNLEVLYENTIIEKGSIKTSLNRLAQKGFLIREEIKNGRSGWVIFRIPDTVYQELFNNDISLTLTQTRHKLDTEPNTEPNTTSSIVVSNDINITTTSLPEDFKQIDFSCLSDYGLDESHIIQIYREYSKKPELSLSAEIIQNSIYALAFDLKHNNVADSFKQSPVVLLTALLKKGQPYSSKTPDKVLSPQEEAMQEYVIAQTKRCSKILEIETQAKGLALQEWLRQKTDLELLAEFNPNNEPQMAGLTKSLQQTLAKKKAVELAKEHFEVVVLPTKIAEILSQKT